MRTFRSFLSQQALVRTASLALPLAAVTVLPACDLFNQVAAAAQNAANISVDETESTNVSLDVSALTGALAGQPAPAPGLTQDLALPPVAVDLNKSQPNIAKYANGHIVTLEINKIAVTPSSNTLTADLPALDIYFGPTTAKTPADGIKVATIPPIKAGSTTAVDATIDAAAMTQAGTKYLSTLAFSQIMDGKLVIATGGMVPGGKVDLKLDLGLHAVVTPL